MNNNRNNNRRRGRGGNRQQGGGQQLNRIDSRARGNAPQLLEKYRKLAHDAHLNGDRVQEEYYLQFADHYFRVLADQRARQDEQRQRRDDRWQDGGDAEREFPDEGEYGGANDYRAYEQSTFQRPREEEREPEEARTPEAPATDEDEPRSIYEPAANPFVREPRGSRGLRPRRDDRRNRDEDRSQAAGNRAEAEDGEPAGLDPSMLPPAISASREDEAIDSVAEAAPPRRRGRRPRPPVDDSGEELAEAS